AEPRLGKVVGDVGQASSFPYFAFIIMPLTIEVPLIFDSRDSHPLCAHEVFFNAQSAAQFLMSALPPKADIERLSRNVR
ncbi:MAG: hypothetical protein WA322_24805, partial [Pseudolabrys sp.]